MSNNKITKKQYDKDLAIIFKKCEEKKSTIYLPVKVVSGKLDEESLTFTSNNITYDHIIKEPKQVGFAFSKTLTETIKNNNSISGKVQKRKILKTLKKYKYTYSKDENENPIITVQALKGTPDIDILYEDELLNYYIKNYPNAKEIITLLKKASGKIYLDVKEISKTLEEKLTNNRQAKEILTSMWKHINSNEPYNIFINGSDITPKKDIVKTICELSNIPCYYVSADNKSESFNFESIINFLLEESGNNQNQLEHSVLVIDNIDKLATNSSSEEEFRDAKHNLIRLLSGEKILLDYNHSNKVYLDTSKIMIIGMGNFKKREKEHVIINGFYNSQERKEEKDKYKNDIPSDLLEYFSKIIQMDKPIEEDYRQLLIRRVDAGLLSNKEFLQRFNIKLLFDKKVIDIIAREAYEKKLSQKEIRLYIENLLSKASLEIAMHPNLYKELIITPETIIDNKVYKLIRKKSNEENN